MASARSSSSNIADAHSHGPPHRSHTIDVIEHRVDSEFDSVKRWRKRKTALSLPEWSQRNRRLPYHDYVHQLVEAGWENLSELDRYLTEATVQQPGLMISVLDIEDDFTERRWPDIYNEHDLKEFIKKPKASRTKVRFYLAEYSDRPATCVIEAFGSALKLDPRFFIWSIHSKGHVSTPSQRHRAPYVSLGFGVLNASTPRKTDAERFNVLVYVQPDEHGDGWTAIILFSSHVKINLSPRIVTDPPPFNSQLPPPKALEPVSFRELYIESFELLDLKKAAASPFYAVASLLRINSFCWNQIITAIREEDRRINGISDTSVGHAEEIKKSLGVAERGGSLGWKVSNDKMTEETRDALVEDFRHLVDQTDLLWQAREKMAAIRQRKSETRWSALTNAFTYLFAPITIMTGVYGMNVSQISGSSSNPNIWQFFVAVAAMNVALVLVLAISNWIHIQLKHGRVAGLKEVLGFAVGRQSMK